MKQKVKKLEEKISLLDSELAYLKTGINSAIHLLEQRMKNLRKDLETLEKGEDR